MAEKANTPKKTNDTWEVKDRTYVLASSRKPLTYKAKSTGILYYDEATGKNRELRYATNQNSIFVDEQDDHARLGHIIFQDGVLHVTKTQRPLQELLSLYHPLANQKWVELDAQKEAGDELSSIEAALEAMKVAQSLEVGELEAILRTEIGSDVVNLTSKELRRDAYNFASRNPQLFLELANDEEIQLRNLGNRAVEIGIIELVDDGTVFRFTDNKKKILTVPFDKHPFKALADYFKTDEGVALHKSLLKKV